MTDIVVNVLQQLGPCVTSDLVAALIKEHKLAPAAARQRVSRSTTIKKLAHLTFPRGARFVYLQSDYASQRFWEALVQCLRKHTISYGGGVAALLARGGVMPVAHFEIACGAPIAQKRHVSASAVLRRLKDAGLVRTFDVPGIGECVELPHKVAARPFEIAAMRSRLRTEELLLTAVKDWARNLGLVSYNKVAIRDHGDKQPRVGTFSWDLSAPSYLGALLQWDGGKAKSGFLVCDVLLGVNVSADELQPFVNKCATLRSMPKVGRCLQFFVADGYQPDALALAKQNGIVPATTETLFGIEVASALRNLADILKEVYPDEGTLERVDEVFRRLSHIEGAANNLRGALFEYLVAEIVRLGSPYTNLRLNEILRDPEGKSAEVDVLVYHMNQSVRFIECKGYKPGGTVPDDMVQHWIKDRIPLIRRIAEFDHYWRNCNLEFELWTSGKLSPESKAMVDAEIRRVRKIKLRVFEGQEVESAVRNTNNAALKKTYGEHFLGHPLAKKERGTNKIKRRLPIPPNSTLNKREVDVDMLGWDDVGEANVQEGPLGT
ncbi:hypothetical protein [Burkholderia glumae]